VPYRFADLNARASKLISDLEAAGVPVPPSSRLRRYANALNEAVAADGVRRPESAELALWHRLLIEVEDLDVTTRVLSQHPEVPSWSIHLKRSLAGAALRSDENLPSPARDVQFELILAALFRRAGFSVSLDEPDVIVLDESRRFGVAAKRPRSHAKLEKNIRDARRQVQQSGLPGMIAVDVSCILNPEDTAIETANFTAANAAVVDAVSSYLRENSYRISRWIASDRVFGVVLHYAKAIHETVTPMLAYRRQWSAMNLAPQDHPATRYLLNILGRIEQVETAA